MSETLAVLGSGAWGTALAIHFARRRQVRLYCRSEDQSAEMQQRRSNPQYLPGIAFPENLTVSSDLAATINGVDWIVIATPIAGLRPTVQRLHQLCNELPPVLWACKGFEAGTGRLPHQVIEEEWPELVCGALSGPSFAKEVALGLPAALALASRDGERAIAWATALTDPRLRLYSTPDLVGVEVGAAVKNVVAIAAGICDGLQLGFNARAALITRGVAEMARLGVALGGVTETFMGLSGLGDLLLTATGDLSRNRRVGLAMAAGQPLEQVLGSLGHVAEGVATAREVLALSRRLNVDMPITEAVCAILFDGVSSALALETLLHRAPRQE